jgi:hypothetical protein
MSRCHCVALLALWLVGCGDAKATSTDATFESCTPSFTPPEFDQAAVDDHCSAFAEAFCIRQFGDCDNPNNPPTFDECKNPMAALCSLRNPGATVDSSSADTCVSEVTNGPCSQFEGAKLQSCQQAIVPIPPDLGTCNEVQPGTLEGTIAENAAHTNDAPFEAYCLCLDAGSTVTLEVAARGASPVGDTVLSLVDNSGRVVAYNDDDISGGTSYSKIPAYQVATGGPHMILVQPYSPEGDVGDFSLTISVVE